MGATPYQLSGGGGGGANSHSEPGLYPPLKDTALSQNGYGAGLGFRVCLVFFPSYLARTKPALQGVLVVWGLEFRVSGPWALVGFRVAAFRNNAPQPGRGERREAFKIRTQSFCVCIRKLCTPCR